MGDEDGKKGKKTKDETKGSETFVVMFVFALVFLFLGVRVKERRKEEDKRGTAHGASMRWESGLVVLDLDVLVFFCSPCTVKDAIPWSKTNVTFVDCQAREGNRWYPCYPLHCVGICTYP